MQKIFNKNIFHTSIFFDLSTDFANNSTTTKFIDHTHNTPVGKRIISNHIFKNTLKRIIY